MPAHPFTTIERTIVDFFEEAGADVVDSGLEWFVILYDEGPQISLTALATAVFASLSVGQGKVPR